MTVTNPNPGTAENMEPSWLTEEIASLIQTAEQKGWSIWHWLPGDGGVGETAAIAPGYCDVDIKNRWPAIQKGIGGETEPFLRVERLRQIASGER